MNLLFLDVESTDLDKNNRLVQLAYKHLPTGQLVNEYFKPTAPISFGAMAVHHITNEMVENKPFFSESEHYQTLSKLLEGNILVAHNALFDMQVLKNEGIATGEYIDTLRIARHLLKSEQYNLQFLRYSLGLNVVATPHDALGDIIVLEALFNYLKDEAKKKFTLSDEEVLLKILELNKKPVLLDNINFGKYRGKTFEETAKNDRGYLDWLLNSETQKNPEDQNQELVHTLKYHLSI